jgi:anti-sigma factor RsiW
VTTCREIEGLLGRRLDEEATPAERARAEAHLAVCPGCRAEAAALGRTDRALRRAFAGHPFDAALARRVAAAARARPAGRVVPGPWARLRGAVTAAAAAAVLVAVGLAVRAGFAPGGASGPIGVASAAPVARVRALLDGRVRVSHGDGIGDVSYVAPGGELALRAGDRITTETRGGEIELPDGTRVIVRADTRVVLLGGAAGEAGGIALGGAFGEVFCEVAKQAPGRTFRVETPGARVEVVGTRFGVRLEAGGATVATVLEGQVRMAPLAGGEAVLLGRDEQGRVAARDAAVRVGRVAAWRDLAWATGGAQPGGAEPAPAPAPGGSVGEPVPPAAAGADAAGDAGDADLPVGPR